MDPECTLEHGEGGEHGAAHGDGHGHGVSREVPEDERQAGILVAVLLLEGLGGRLNGLHLRGALDLLLIEREGQQLQDQREQDDRRAVSLVDAGALESAVQRDNRQLKGLDEDPAADEAPSGEAPSAASRQDDGSERKIAVGAQA